MTIIQHKKRLLAELKDKEYRDAYVSSSVDIGIAFQIRALRKRIGLTQEELAEKANMKQERISALENPSNSPNITTLKKLANALNIGLIVRFVPISKLVEWELNLSPDSLEVLSFDEESYFQDIEKDQSDFTLQAKVFVDQEGLAGTVLHEDISEPLPFFVGGKLPDDTNEIIYNNT
jgi:transcriptional regulator with XRE-family HTH domain